MPSREQLVMDTFVEMADTLASDYDIGDFLQTLIERCSVILEVETGGVLLEDPEGNLRLAAALSDSMRELEDLEIRLKQGPCLDAYQHVDQILAADLHKEHDRWPGVAPKAIAMGLRAAYAFPLRLRGDCIGAMNLYRERPGEFYDEDIRVAQAFADVATIGILQERKVSSAERRAQQLQGALASRVLVEQAKGIVAERYHVPLQEAFEAIRRHARSSNRKLREVCGEIVDGGDPVTP